MEVKVHWHLRRVLPLSWVVSWSLHLPEGQCAVLSEDGRWWRLPPWSFFIRAVFLQGGHRSHELNPSPKAPPLTLDIKTEFLSPKPDLCTNMYIAEVHSEFLSYCCVGSQDCVCISNKVPDDADALGLGASQKLCSRLSWHYWNWQWLEWSSPLEF